MPELPEVETIKRDLEKIILNKQISKIIIKKKKLVKNPADFFVQSLVKKKIIKIERKGKMLLFHLSSGLYLVIHLRMTGQLIYCFKKECIAGGHANKGEEDYNNKSEYFLNSPGKYTHIIFSFSDSSHLFYNDLRQFGYLKILNKSELEPILGKIGIDPTTEKFMLKTFLKMFLNKKATIKSLLLKQNFISGIGNIYADEVLFASGIRPNRRADKIKEDEKKELFLNIKKILKKAIIYKGTTFSDYRDLKGRAGNYSKFLKVYGRGGRVCLVCGQKIIKTKISQRGTAYCPKCQR